MVGQEPNVVSLQIHLPHQQRIVFDTSANLEHIVECGKNADTSLLAFFKTNQLSGPIGDLARTLTYQEFPNHFVLQSDKTNPQSKVWQPRHRNSFALGHMVYVPPTAGERFHLRMLLMVIKGPRSFEDLKNVDGHVYDTFHDACLQHGLLEDDGEWDMCLHDAADVQTGAQLRRLFATLLLFCTPTQPNVLWINFCDKICDDLRHKLHGLGRTNVSESDVYDYGLHLINDILHDSGHTLSDFPNMPLSHLNWSGTLHNHLISQQMNYDPVTEASKAHLLMSSLNSDQRLAFEIIWQSIIHKEGKTFFINGYGGCGKTYLYQAITHAVRAEGLIVLCVASTGLACLLLPGGQTAHSMFKIPIDTLTETSTCTIPKESLRAHLLRMADAVIYDECLMNK